jgi:hypothetical protein
MNTNRIMEKARLLSIVQRLKRTLGEEPALDLVMAVVEQEFKTTINKCYEKETSTGKAQSQS